MPLKKIILEKFEIIFSCLCALAGFLITAYLLSTAISRSTSSTAAIGYIFMPFYALIIAIIAGLVGYCIAYVFKGALSKSRKFNWKLCLALIIALFITGYGIHVFQQLASTKKVIQTIPFMDEPELNMVVDQLITHPKRYRIFELSMILQNPNTSADTLDRIANIDDKQLNQRMGSIFDIMGDNTRGLSVMRLITRHPNVTPEILTKLSVNAEPYLQADIAQNPKTPEKTLRELYQKNDRSTNMSLAFNPSLPMDILVNLSNSDDSNVLIGIANNRKTPIYILEKLANNKDKWVSQRAQSSLEMHRLSPWMFTK